MGCCCCRYPTFQGLTTLWVYDPVACQVVWRRPEARQSGDSGSYANTTGRLPSGKHLIDQRYQTTPSSLYRPAVADFSALPDLVKSDPVTVAGTGYQYGLFHACDVPPSVVYKTTVTTTTEDLEYWGVSGGAGGTQPAVVGVGISTPTVGSPSNFARTFSGQANPGNFGHYVSPFFPQAVSGALHHFSINSSGGADGGTSATIDKDVYSPSAIISSTTLTTITGLAANTVPFSFGSTGYVFKTVSGVVHLLSYDLTTGTQIDDVTTALSNVNGRGCPGNGFIWVRDAANANLYCIEVSSGNTLVSSSIPGTDRFPTPATDATFWDRRKRHEHIDENGDFIYFAHKGASYNYATGPWDLIRQSKQTGAVLWRLSQFSSLGSFPAWGNSSFITTIDGQTYLNYRSTALGDNFRVTHLDSSGTVKWRSPLGSIVGGDDRRAFLSSATRMADGRILMTGLLPLS